MAQLQVPGDLLQVAPDADVRDPQTLDGAALGRGALLGGREGDVLLAGQVEQDELPVLAEGGHGPAQVALLERAGGLLGERLDLVAALAPALDQLERLGRLGLAGGARHRGHLILRGCAARFACSGSARSPRPASGRADRSVPRRPARSPGPTAATARAAESCALRSITS